MKNKLFSIIPLILLTGCNSKTTSLSIISATGAPSLGFYRYSTNENFETNSDPSNIIAFMANKTKDIVVLPTNAGIQAIQKKKLDYKIAATITFGNLFIASTGNDDDGIMDKDDYIVLFQQQSFPDKVFHYIYGSSLDEGIHYVSNAKEAAACLKTGKNLSSNNEKVDYVLLAEPALYSVLSTTEGRSEYLNIQNEYKNKSGGFNLFQASVFISNNVSKNDADYFLSSLEDDINSALINPEMMTQELLKSESSESVYGCKPQVAEQVTKNGNRMGLGFKKAIDNKDAIDKFLEIFNMEKTNEEIYYK